MRDVSWESALQAAAAARADELSRLASELAASAGADPAGPARIAVRYLESHGLFPFAHQAEGPSRQNVLARYDGGHARSRRHLVLCGRARETRPGDAACLAGALWATATVAELGVPLAGPLTVLVIPGDDPGESGVPWVLDRDLIESPTGALVAAATGRHHPGVGQLGRCRFEVRLTATGAAADTPDGGASDGAAGDSVIVRAALAVLALRDVAALRAEPPDDVAEVVAHSVAESVRAGGEGARPALDRVGVNIGTINGGSAAGAIPRRCDIGVDCALPFGIDRSQVLKQAEQVLADAGVDGEIVEKGAGCLASLTPSGDPLVRSLLGAVRDVVDARAHGVLHAPTGDARWFRERGIPAVQYGPSDGGGTAAADAAAVYALAVLRYLRTAG